MIIVSILLSIAAIAVICCLLFYFAVYALPLFVGATAGVWTYDTGTGWLGGIAVGVIAVLATLLVGHLLLAFVKPLWLRLVTAAAFIAPAATAGYHATHGIVKHTMPSETWQVAFSVTGAVVVGIAAFARLATLAPPGHPDGAWPAPDAIPATVAQPHHAACESSSSVGNSGVRKDSGVR